MSYGVFIFNKLKKVFVSVTNDLVADQRIHRVCSTLTNMGFCVTLLGRRKANSKELNNRSYTTFRFQLLVEKGPLFYIEYNLRLFFFLLTRKSNVLVSNDLDTLFANYLVSKLKRTFLVYDSHEFFTGVPELAERPFVRGIWNRIEKFILPKLKKLYTVNDSIAKLYLHKYNVDMKVIKNFPYLIKNEITKTKSFLGFDESSKIILYQGAVNKDRGLEEVIIAMKFVQDAILVIIGDGDVAKDLKVLVLKENLEKKVFFLGIINFELLPPYTAIANIGLSIEKDTNLNYKFCLPNKLFDYIQAEVPVLATPLEEIKKVYDKFNIGEFIESHEPSVIANKINYMLKATEKQKWWRQQLLLAKEEYNWNKEEAKLKEIYSDLL